MRYLLTTLLFISSVAYADSLISSPKISINDSGLRLIELNIRDSNINDEDIKLLEYKSEDVIDDAKIAYTLLRDNDAYYVYSIALSNNYSSDYFSFKLKIKDKLSKDIFIFLPSTIRSSNASENESKDDKKLNPLSRKPDSEIFNEPPVAITKNIISDPITDQDKELRTISAGEIKTMWSLASDIAKTNNNLSIYQIMWSIYLGNPSAFIDDNINLVRSDIDIVIPSYQSMELNSASDSKNAIIKMNQAFSLNFKKSAKSLLTLTAPKIQKTEKAEIIKEQDEIAVNLASIDPASKSPEDIISKNTSTLKINAKNEVIEDITKTNSLEKDEPVNAGLNYIDLLFVAAISVISGVLLALIFIQLNKNKKKTIVYDFDEAPSSGPETKAMPSGLSIKNNQDEQELDLAATYIEMDELEQALNILNNLLKKSDNETSKIKAKELVSLISSK